MQLIKQLREEIVNEKVGLSTALRRAKVLAAKLKHAEFRRWVDKELTGYNADDDVPAYRTISVQNTGTITDGFKIMTNAAIAIWHLEENGFKDHLTQHTFYNGAKVLESLATYEKPALNFQWEAEALQYYNLQTDLAGGRLIDAARNVSRAGVEGILDTIRDRLLEFVLQLEEIQPEIMDDDKAISGIPPEKINQVFNVTIHGDHAVLASGTGFSQTVHQTVASHDLTALVQYFRQYGVDEEDLEELKTAIEEDGERPDRSFGQKVKAWIGKMTTKAVQGVWKTALEAAPKLLVEGLSHYYGWNK